MELHQCTKEFGDSVGLIASIEEHGVAIVSCLRDSNWRRNASWRGGHGPRRGGAACSWKRSSDHGNWRSDHGETSQRMNSIGYG